MLSRLKRGRNKRGMTLLEFVIDIIIAIVCIIILFYISATIYNLFFGKQNIAKAEGQLEEIKEAITAANANPKEKYGFMLYSPSGWYLVKVDVSGNEDLVMPLTCQNKNCIAICPKPTWRKINCKDGKYEVLDKPIMLPGNEEYIKIEGIKEICIKDLGTHYIMTEEECEEAVSPGEIEEIERTESELSSVMEYISQNAISNSRVSKLCKCGSECGEYASWMVKYSKQYEIPDAFLIVALMIQESSCDKNIGCTKTSCGLMMIDKNQENWEDPETNIKKGIAILKAKYDQYGSIKKQFTGACSEEYKQKIYTGWEAALRGYNGWSCNSDYPNQDYFVTDVMTLYNTLKSLKV